MRFDAAARKSLAFGGERARAVGKPLAGLDDRLDQRLVLRGRRRHEIGGKRSAAVAELRHASMSDVADRSRRPSAMS